MSRASLSRDVSARARRWRLSRAVSARSSADHRDSSGFKHPAVGLAGVERVLAAQRGEYFAAALAAQEALWERGATGRDCYMVALFRAALSSLARK